MADEEGSDLEENNPQDEVNSDEDEQPEEEVLREGPDFNENVDAEEEEQDKGMSTVFHDFPMVHVVNPLDELNDEDLVATVEDLQKDTKHVELENLVFEHFLELNDPTALGGMDNVLKSALLMQERSSISSSRRITLTSQMSSRRGSTLLLSSDDSLITPAMLERGPKINLTQRTDLVLREMEEIQTGLEELNRKSHLIKCRLMAELEEMSVRESEIRETMDVFENSIVIGGVDPITQKIPAEKFVRYMEEWLRSALLTIDKIRLRTSSLKVQYQKVCHTLTQKQLLGENLQEVDFEQLQIENKHLLEKIELKTALLLELKKMNGNASLALNNHKKQLQKRLDDMRALNETIRIKEQKIILLDEECDKASKELDEAKDKYQSIKEQVEAYKVPELMDYVRKKAELYQLEKEIKVWARRKQIKDLALVACIREMRQLTGRRNIDPDWFIVPSQSENSSTTSFHFQTALDTPTPRKSLHLEKIIKFLK